MPDSPLGYMVNNLLLLPVLLDLGGDFCIVVAGLKSKVTIVNFPPSLLSHLHYKEQTAIGERQLREEYHVQIVGGLEPIVKYVVDKVPVVRSVG